MRLTMFSLGAPVKWLVCSKNIIKSSTFEILSDVSSGAKSRAKYCTSQIWQCAVIGLTATFNRRWGPPKKVANYWMGSPFNGWLTSEWSLSGDQAQHCRKKEKEIGVGVKKKRASEASVVSGETIFFLFDPVFPLFLPRSCIFNRVSRMGRIFWGFKGQISQESSLLQWDHNSLKNHTSVTLTCDPAVLLPFFFGKKKESLIAGYSNPH